MKKIIVFTLSAVICQSCYTRIGDLNMASNRNVESSVNYVLKEKYVIAKGKSKTGDALEVALDNAVKKIDGGEFMKNVKISVKNNGRKVKVEGDVWGL